MAKRIIINNKSDLEERDIALKVYEFLDDYIITGEINYFKTNIITFGKYVCYAKLNNTGSLSFTFYNQENK